MAKLTKITEKDMIECAKKIFSYNSGAPALITESHKKLLKKFHKKEKKNAETN